LKEALGLLQYSLACPNSREVSYLFGQAYEKVGRDASAIESYERVLRIEPDFSPAQKKLDALKRTDKTAK
jgi:tetratricopeptide (TPR) repeat protein